MADNIQERTGAAKVSIWMRNYPYSSAVSDLYNLTMVYLTDLGKLAYKNGHPDLKNGTLRKLLEDSSGSSNIPENSFIYADSNGRATFSEYVYFDAVNERLISEKGIDLGNGFVLSTTSEYLEITHNGNDIGWKMYK